MTEIGEKTNTEDIVSYFPQKSCHQAEMAEICAETVVWTQGSDCMSSVVFLTF